MPVEIPVVIDIEKGFADAVQRVPAAMRPLQQSIQGLSEQLTVWQEQMSKSKIDSPQWKNAAKHIQAISQALEVANDRLLKYTTNDGSIRRMNAELASLNRRWEEMGAAQKFDKKGNLTSEAKQLWTQYKQVTAELEKQGRTLAQIEAEEKRVLDLARRRNELSAQGSQKRKYENAILNTTVRTLQILQEQERILSRQLSQATIGSDKYTKLQERLRGVQAEMRKAQGVTERTTAVFQRQTGVLGKLTTTFASYISIYSLLRFAKQIRDVTGELEYQRVALGHLIQDEEYGAVLFERIKAAAIESPFRIKDLVTYTKQLAAFRIEQEELFSTMTRLADISAGLGVDMDRLILAYGQVRAASVLRGQELRQFTEAGIPLVDMLAEKFSELNGRVVKTSEVFELISKRAVPFSMIGEIFEDLTDKGGMFYKMQEQQAATLKGQWEKLKDAFDIGLQTIGETKSFERINSIILKTLNLLARNLQVVPKIIEAAGAAWLAYTLATSKARSATMAAARAEVEETVTKEAQTIANVRGIKHVDAYTAAMIRQRTATNGLSRAFWKLWAAVVASPLGATLAVVSAIAAAFFLWKKRTDEVTSSFKELDDLIEETSVGLKDTSKLDKMISRYEMLASKTDRTVKENNRLYQTMTQLQEAFPNVQIGIDNETESLEAQLVKLREANKLREEEIRLRAETELGAQEVKLTQAEDRRVKLYKERFKYIQDAARIEKEMAFQDLYKDSSDWKKAKEKAGEISEELIKQDQLIEGIQKRIEALNRILYGESTAALNAWQRQIQSMRDIKVGDVTSPLFTDEDIEKWETLDAALDAIEKAKKNAQEQEQSLSEAIKGQTGDIRDQIQAELDWARATRMVAESMEDFFKTPTIFAKDIMSNFPELLAKTYDEGVIEKLGEMNEEYARLMKMRDDLPEKFLISEQELAGLREATDVGDLIESKISAIEKELDAIGKISIENLDEDEIKKTENYRENLEEIYGWLQKLQARFLSTANNMPDIAQDIIENFDDILGRNLQNGKGVVVPVEFMLSDKELQELYNVGDLFDLLDKKISGIEKEIETVNATKITEGVSEEVIENAELYALNLERIRDVLLQIQGRYRDQLSDIAKDVKEAFPDLMAEAYRNMGKSGYASQGLFSDEEMNRIHNIVDLYDVWSSKLQSVQKAKENFNKVFSTAIDEETRQNALDSIESLTEQEKNLLEFITRYGFILPTKTTGSSEQDPWILIFKDRVKFMKDFRDGVEDLDQYLTHNQSIAKQREIMEGRGKALGFDVSSLDGSREELLKWYDDTIESITKEIEKLGGKTWSGLGVQAILAKDTKNRTLKAWQDLLADVFKERTDFELSQTKKDIEDALKRLTDDIKRSETARDFYQNILDLTGDQDLAENLSVSIYGSIGKDFKERIQEELYRALTELGGEGIDNDLLSQIMGDITLFDIDDIKANLDKLPPKVKDVFEQALQDNEKYNADWYADFIKTYQKAKTYQERVDNLERQRQQKMREADAMGVSQSDKDSVTEYYNREIAKVQLEAMKDTYTWTKAFEDLDGVSSQTLRNLISLIDEYIGKYGKDLEPQQLKELARQRQSAKQQLNSRNAYLATAEALKDLTAARMRANELRDDGEESSEEYTKALDDEAEAIKKLREALQEIEDEMNSVISSTKDLMNVFASDDDASYFGGQLDNFSKTFGGITKAATGIAQIAAGQISPQAIVQAITGVADVVSGIFGGINAARMRSINRQIERQQELVEDLEYSYDRLGVAIEKAFGSDYIYNYNKQLENLYARMAAYEEQARLEREKGKKADEEKIKDFENSARATADQIADMQSQVANFFTGSDVTSAATDFASAWIEAYKEFGSTTDAMREKFQDMIQNMIQNSLAAKIMQSILQPLFDEIDEMSRDNELSASDIAKIASDAPGYIANINNAMTTLMNQLAAAGYNVRQQVGSFTGISRNIANASEESINGLAAGINTQNFYISHIDMTVSAILSALTGGTAGGTDAAGNEVVDPYKNQMLLYVASLPQMRDDMASVRSMLEKVIRPLGTTTTHYVAVKI